jgi:hypothetical protein
MACSPSSSASNESCSHFVTIAELANRPKNIRIHLAVSHVRFYLLRFNSSGNFCDGSPICSRGLLPESATSLGEGHGYSFAPLARDRCYDGILPVVAGRMIHDNNGALLNERFRDTGSNALRSAVCERNLTIQFSRRCSSSFICRRRYTRTVPPSTTTVCPVLNPSCIRNR